MTPDPSRSITVPKVSVVIPTRHRNDLLALCLDRLKPGAQLLGPSEYEVIVSDDGVESTAQTMIRDHYPWAHWVAGPRRGPASNRNNGARQARGAWIAFTDDDCLPEPGWLSNFLAAADSDSADVLEGRVTSDPRYFTPMVNAPLNETGGYLWSCNFMIRRDVFEQFRFDEDYPMPAGEDVDFRQRLIQAGLKFPFVREALVVHPPRRQRFGVAQARLHESAFIAWHKARTQPPSWIKYILRLGKHRTINILKFRPSLDSGIAVVSVAVEIAAIVCFYPKWKRRHGIDPHSPR